MAIQIEPDKSSLIIRANSQRLDKQDIESCAAACERVGNSHELIIFDFSQVRHASDEVLRALVEIANTESTAGRKVFVLAHPELADVVSARNIEHVFQGFIRSSPPKQKA